MNAVKKIEIEASLQFHVLICRQLSLGPEEVDRSIFIQVGSHSKLPAIPSGFNYAVKDTIADPERMTGLDSLEPRQTLFFCYVPANVMSK